MPDSAACLGEGGCLAGWWYDSGDPQVWSGIFLDEIANFPNVERVLPIEVGGVFSADASIDWRDWDDEVAVKAKKDESLSRELIVLLFCTAGLLSWDIWRLDFCEGLELALGRGLVNGLESGWESNIWTCFSRPAPRRGIATPARDLGGIPTFREVGEGDWFSSTW
jgi:hypothetical protein